MELWAEPQTAFRLVRREMAAAQRIAVQPPRARRKNCQKANDLAREAVDCNGGLGDRIVSEWLFGKQLGKDC